MRRRQMAWYLWAIGSALIVLSWFDVVSYQVGWFGFVIGMFGSVMGWGLMPPSDPNIVPQDPDEKPTNT